MDPLTHMVVGRAVVAAVGDGNRPGRGVAAAAILGALSPDADAIVAFFGWDRYLRIHEIGTHAIAGAIVMACLTAAVVRLVVRMRGHQAPAGAVLAAAIAGAMSHLLLDLACGGQIRAGWPLVESRLSLPLVAMADPWLIAICLVGVLAVWPGRVRWRTASRVLLAAAVAFLAVKGVLLAAALRSANLHTSMTAIEARWASFTEWSVFERTAQSVDERPISSVGGRTEVGLSHRLGPETPLVKASRSLDTVQNFLSVHAFSFPVERVDESGQTEVLWTDLRYCERPESEPEATVEERSIACGLWAGGLFDRDGRAIRQIVKVGALVQERPAPR